MIEEERDYCPVCQLWLSEGRPGLDPRDGEGFNPAVLSPYKPQRRLNVPWKKIIFKIIYDSVLNV